MTDSDEPAAVIKRIREFAQTREFEEYAEATAAKIVTHLFTDAGRTWRQAARANSRGALVLQSLLDNLSGPLGMEVRHQIARNAEIIKTLPLDIADQVTEHVFRQTLQGTRASDIAQQIKAYFPQASAAKANLIARTETSKTATAITQARSQQAGVNWYVWRTSEDSRVRGSHRIMDVVLINWRDPPSPEQLDGDKPYGHYHAGDTFNCRCYPEPVIDLDLIRWPAKVYRNGSIQRMSRRQFEQIE